MLTMKVLVANSERTERERIVAMLEDHCDVQQAEPSDHLGDWLLGTRTQVAIVDPARVPQIVRASTYVRTIALIAAEPTPEDFSAAYELGADDVLRTHACAQEVVRRIAGVIRMRPKTAPPPTVTMRIRRVKAWKDIEQIVASELSELLGTSLRSLAIEERPLTYTSVIPLTLVSDHLLVQLGLGVDERTRDQLVELLLGGDSSGDAMCDALREMANTAGGAIRRAALTDGVSFSIGLPSNENLFGAVAGKRRIWSITNDAGLRLDCMVALTANDPTRIAAKDLREGMVVAHDVVDPMGYVIVAEGVSLTCTTVDEIVAAVGAATPVEIARSTAA